MFEELKDKKIRRLKAYKDIISSFKAIGYDIVSDIGLVRYLDTRRIYDHGWDLEEFKRCLSSIGVLCSSGVLSELESKNYIIKNDKCEDIKNALEELSKVEKQFGIELPVILSNKEIYQINEERKKEEEERIRQEEIERYRKEREEYRQRVKEQRRIEMEAEELNKEQIEQEKEEFCKMKTNSSNINYIFVGNVNSKPYSKVCNNYFDKNGNQIDPSKCSKLLDYTMKKCGTYSNYNNNTGRSEDTYLAINTEKESIYLFRKEEIFCNKFRTICFSDDITNDDLERMYYMLRGNINALETFKEYLLNGFKENEYLISRVERRLEWLINIGQRRGYAYNQIYNFGDIEILFKYYRDRRFVVDDVMYYIIKAKKKDDSEWERLYSAELCKNGEIVDASNYANKSKIIEPEDAIYIYENLASSAEKDAFGHYINHIYDHDAGTLEYMLKLI